MDTEPEENLLFQRKLVSRRFTTKWTDLDEILDKGMAPRHLAAMLGIGVIQLRSWRRKRRGWFSELMSIAQVLAVLDMLEHYGLDNPVAWLETPIHPGSGITPLDLYPGGLSLMLGLASGRVRPEDVLDIYDPGWRRPVGWETFENPDGELSISPARKAI